MRDTLDNFCAEGIWIFVIDIVLVVRTQMEFLAIKYLFPSIANTAWNRIIAVPRRFYYLCQH